MNGNEFKSIIFPVMVSLLIVFIAPLGSAEENENSDSISDLVLEKVANPGLYHVGNRCLLYRFLYGQAGLAGIFWHTPPPGSRTC